MAKLAINGGRPVIRKGSFAHLWPVFNKNDERAILEVLRSGKWCRTFSGSRTEEFEEAFARFQGARYGLAVANGTVAIELALRMLGITIGDEVIIPAVTFIATASAVAQLGAIPVFTDIDIDTGQIDANSIKENITPRTKGVVVVHYGGYPVNFDKIIPVVKRNKLFLVEDCAHAHGTEWKDRKVGTFGDFGCFSFQQTKSLTSGDGGAVITNSKKLYEKAVLTHNIGRILGKPTYRHEVLSSNYRMTEFQGALLLNQLKRLPEQTELKHENGEWLADKINGIQGLSSLKPDQRITKRGYYYFVFRYDKREFSGLSRDKFIEALNAEGVPCWGGYGSPVYRYTAFRKKQLTKILPERVGHLPNYERLNLQNSEQFCKEQVVIPHHVLLSERKYLRLIPEAILKVRQNIRELVKESRK